MIFNLTILITIAVVVLGVGTKVYLGYRAATGSPWKRLLAATKDSATVLWGYIVAAGGLVLVWAGQAAVFFNLPEVSAFIQQHLSPESVGVAMTVIAVITIVARLRTLFSSS